MDAPDPKPAGDGYGGNDANLAGRDRGDSNSLLGAGDGDAERVGGIERAKAGIQTRYSALRWSPHRFAL